jgi:hypothetical protein
VIIFEYVYIKYICLFLFLTSNVYLIAKIRKEYEARNGGMVMVLICTPSIWDAEAGGPPV